jgi:DNA sulfur modification protein DndB
MSVQQESPAVEAVMAQLNTPGGLAAFNPSEGIPFSCQVLDRHKVIGAMPGALLEQVTYDPRTIEDKRAPAYDPRLHEAAEIRREVQRLFEGVKKANVNPYAEYIGHLARDEQYGITPPIILWSPEPLQVLEAGYGLHLAVIPFGKLFVPIDGETQLAARYEAWERDSTVRDQAVPVMIAHGLDSGWARQAFHDINVLGRRPNAAIAISMDNRDPATQIARDLETKVGYLKGRINTMRRQLRKTDRNAGQVMTVTALRSSVVTIAEGIGGVAHGTKPVQIEQDSEVARVAAAWWDALGEHLGDEIAANESVASSPAAIAALGAVGHRLHEAGFSDDGDLEDAADDLARALSEDIDWMKGSRWAGIAGKFTPKGAFSVGGAKETSYRIYEALVDETSDAFRRIRPALTAEPPISIPSV